MGTLEEVIKAIEVCRDAYVAGKIIKSDALHYLKEYQRYQNTPSRNGHMALVDYFEESQKNEPLSWDELKQMEGKPVWVVDSIIDENDRTITHEGHWDIVRKIYPEQIAFYVQGMTNHKSCQGIGWQAYRKERR